MLHLVPRPEMQAEAAEQATRGRSQGGPIIALIPAYNESRFIGSLILTVAPMVDYVIVIDDGSSDGTGDLAQRAGAIVVTHEVNQGKTRAVNTGFSHALQYDPAAVVMLDGDGQHSAEDIPTVLRPVLADEADVVVGSRFLAVKNDIPIYRQVGQHGLNLVTNLTSGVRLSDTQSGFRAFSRLALERLSFNQDGFAIESEMQFQLRDHQLRVIEVPINVVYVEPPKRSPVRHGMQVVNGVLRLVGQTRPLLFFTAGGMATLLAGMALGLYIIHVYVESGVLAIGYGLITVICCVVGVLLLFAGLILHSTRGMLLDFQRSLLNRLTREGES